MGMGGPLEEGLRQVAMLTIRKAPGGSAWEAQVVKHLPSAQVMILGLRWSLLTRKPASPSSAPPLLLSLK